MALSSELGQYGRRGSGASRVPESLTEEVCPGDSAMHTVGWPWQSTGVCTWLGLGEKLVSQAWGQDKWVCTLLPLGAVALEAWFEQLRPWIPRNWGHNPGSPTCPGISRGDGKQDCKDTHATGCPQAVLIMAMAHCPPEQAVLIMAMAHCPPEHPGQCRLGDCRSYCRELTADLESCLQPVFLSLLVSPCAWERQGHHGQRPHRTNRSHWALHLVVVGHFLKYTHLRISTAGPLPEYQLIGQGKSKLWTKQCWKAPGDFEGFTVYRTRGYPFFYLLPCNSFLYQTKIY